MRELTKSENNVIDTLALAWNQYTQLVDVCPGDRSEFLVAIHAAQNIILARPGTEVLAAQLASRR